MKSVFFTFFLLCAIFEASAEFRTWKSVNGDHQVYAELVKLEGGQVTLRRENGAIISLPLTSLTVQDRAAVVGIDLDAAAESGPTETIKLQFPKPMFIGTPVPPAVPNYEPPNPNKIIQSFEAPKGTVNVAKGCKVTSSDPTPIIGDLALVTDGDADGADGNFVELMPGKQWVQIDLKKTHKLQKIALWHFHKQAQVYLDVVVQVSDDPMFKKEVRTVFNNDHDNTSGLGKGKDPAYLETCHGRLIDTKGAAGRHIRFWSSGNNASDMNHYCEVQVFAVPAR